MGTNHYLVWHQGSDRADASIVIATQPGDAARAYVAAMQIGSSATRVLVQPFNDEGAGKVVVLDVFGQITAPPVACHSCGVLVPISMLRCGSCADIGHSVECYTVDDAVSEVN